MGRSAQDDKIESMQFIDTVYAAEIAESAQEGLLTSLGINGTLFIFQLVNFAIVATIIWFLILKPLTKKMTERQKMIDDSIDNSKKIQETLQHSEQKYQERIDQAKVEYNKILEKATVDAVATTDAMKVKAKQEIEMLVDQAKRNIKIEKEEMVSALKNETAGFIVMALEKILGEKVDSKKDKEMIEEMIKKLK